jgi:vacuolar-type H+-ATPase subunit C/Vma6
MGVAGLSETLVLNNKAVVDQIPQVDNFYNYYHEKWGQDNIVDVVTCDRLDGSEFELWW